MVHITCKSHPFKSFQLHLIIYIHFVKKKFKSPTVGDLMRSSTVTFALMGWVSQNKSISHETSI